MSDFQPFHVVTAPCGVSPCVSTMPEFGRSSPPAGVVLAPLVHLGRQRAGVPRPARPAASAGEPRRAATRGGGRARVEAPCLHKSISGGREATP